jgi:hypothetical protein
MMATSDYEVLRILDVAARLERSADAVVGRLKARHGMDDIVGLLFVPTMPTIRSCVSVPTATVRRGAGINRDGASHAAMPALPAGLRVRGIP